MRLDLVRLLAFSCAVTGTLAACAALLTQAEGQDPSVAPARAPDTASEEASFASGLSADDALHQTLVAKPPVVEVARLEPAAFASAFRDNPALLGSIAIGRANRGHLFNAVQLADDDPRWKLEEPDKAFGTQETVVAIEQAIAEVHRLFPDTPVLSVGHLSRASGGWLRPHRSHQNGTDVDLGYYYTDGSRWYAPASPTNLDVPRTWALLSAMERTGGLQYAFIDRSLHQPLRQHAEQIGEPEAFIESMFDGPMPQRGPTIRHARGHATHIHVRFLSPVALENARRVATQVGRRVGSSGHLLRALRVQQQQADKRRARQARLTTSVDSKAL